MYIDNSLDNTKEEIVDNHKSVLCSFEIPIKDGEFNLHSLYHVYWIPLINYQMIFKLILNMALDKPLFARKR